MFEGFPKELPDFLWGLSFHNEKIWFDAHREDYERCLKQPFHALAQEVFSEAALLWPGKLPGLHISRIHRDARRLFGRGPYKDHLWFTLGQSGRLHSPFPDFWFEIGPSSYAYGMGWFETGAEGLELWREQIDQNPARAEKIIRAVEKKNVFTRLGPCYKRPKGHAEDMLRDWYNARGVGVGRTVDFNPDPPGPELAAELIEGFRQLMPLYDYLMEAAVRLSARERSRQEALEEDVYL